MYYNYYLVKRSIIQKLTLKIEGKIKEKFKSIDVLNNENEYKEMIDIICAE